MKAYLLLLIAFLSLVSYSQEKSIIMHKKNSERTIQVAEHKRIKVVTVDGHKYYGRFTVIDSASILIEGKVIQLSSISKMRRKSLFITIANPVFIVVGSVAALTGELFVIAASIGAPQLLGIGASFIPTGTSVAIVPSFSNNHPTYRNWEYAIKSNDKGGPFSNQIKVGQSESKEKSAGGKS